MRVRLDDRAAMMRAAQVGLERRFSGVFNPGRFTGRHPDGVDRWGVDIEGSLAELAVAQALGVPWEPLVDTFKTRPDVGPFEVRSVADDRRRLIIREDDADDALFVLAVGAGRHWEVRGWIRAGDAKAHREWRSDPGGKGAAWFVPHAALRPFAELPLEAKAQCGRLP